MKLPIRERTPLELIGPENPALGAGLDVLPFDMSGDSPPSSTSGVESREGSGSFGYDLPVRLGALYFAGSARADRARGTIAGDRSFVLAIPVEEIYRVAIETEEPFASELEISLAAAVELLAAAEHELVEDVLSLGLAAGAGWMRSARAPCADPCLIIGDRFRPTTISPRAEIFAAAELELSPVWSIARVAAGLRWEGP